MAQDNEEIIFEIGKNNNFMNFENLKEIYSYPNFTDSMVESSNPKNLLQYKTRKFVNNKALNHPIFFELFTERSGNS